MFPEMPQAPQPEQQGLKRPTDEGALPSQRRRIRGKQPDPQAQPKPQPLEVSRSVPEGKEDYHWGCSQPAAPVDEESDREMPDLVASSSDEGENGHMPIFVDMEEEPPEQPKARKGMKRERDYDDPFLEQGGRVRDEGLSAAGLIAYLESGLVTS